METIPHRIFWGLVLILQVGMIYLALTPSLVVNTKLPTLGIVFQAFSCLGILGLVLQRRIFRHNFWAGYFGVIVASALFGLMMLAGFGFNGPTEDSALVVTAIAAVGYILSIFGIFIYVYASPHIWFRPAEA